MSKYLIGNQKMIMLPQDVQTFLNEIKGKLNNNVILCPSSIYLPYYLKQEYQVGVQNIFYEKKGSYTGEISPYQAKGLGVNYCLVGHSERRSYYQEENNDIAKKIKAALESGLKVILCIGETLEQRSLKKTELVLRQEIYQALFEQTDLKNIWIAYEPLWAIGTGKVAEVEEINRIALFIKETVKQYKNVEDIPVIYGGSVNSNNIESLNKIPSIQGFLVGTSSTDALEFLKIKEVVVGQ